ncbi:molybdate transport system ATP-binding protein [Selenomonas ruminantium]|uniref:Molybdate transport system ATP-binding protein n=1 Tax=Selenomonas ruminantium TaxID=971 RepID=A0A1I3CDX8_SELRU|nr:ATP-binding cassette domain-containing protein [Selenomonas ruminantium]SFH72730.1 molybdate transport system ATP-binding protein [Selenomonas ruminantium]
MELIVSIRKQLRSFMLKADFTARDEVFALLGASGCGKSMTLKCIAGIETPDSGRIVLNGRVLYDSGQDINLSPQQRHVGYLFQNYALFPNMTIRENIRFVAGGTPADKEEKVQANLVRFGLTELADAYPRELSGGQQQRAAFARILAADSELLLLDEPFSALDGYLKWQLELELGKVLQAYHGAALLVSHDRGEVYRLSDRAAVISQGCMEPAQMTKELFRQPQTLAATLLTGCKNVSAARKLDDGHVQATEWDLMLATAVEVPKATHYVGVRAHFLELRTAPGENTYPLEVVQVIEDVFSYLVMVRKLGSTGRPIRWELSKADWKSSQQQQGQLYFHIPPEAIMLLQE